jgi:Ca2+-binding RTX toxin-like protein
METTVMVQKVLLGGVDGNFNNEGDSFGDYGDNVYAVYEQEAVHYYDIYTYAETDIIDLRDLNSASTADIQAGAGNDFVFGHAGNSLYLDQSGNDIVLLGDGDDFYMSGEGNDSIDGGASNADRISFAALYGDSFNFAESTDVVYNYSGVTFDLAKTTAQNLGVFGTDTITNFEDINGSLGKDILYGNSDVNLIAGLDGNDYINGRGGNDILYGDDGIDTLRGENGGDTLNVSDVNVSGVSTASRDYLRYYYTSESYAATSAQGLVDWIYDFDKGGGATDDKIDLSRIDAKTSSTTYNNTFVFEGTGGVFNSSYGEIRIIESGGNSYVYVDTDSDSSIEMRFVVAGVTGLTADDFIL